jgi:pyroglutamyl-peptidase
MKPLLLTGFEPFGAYAANPSWDALTLAADEGLLPAETRIARIPVDYARAGEALAAAVNAAAPGAVLSFGLHAGLAARERDVIYVEGVARNLDGALKPDNAGVVREETPIVPEGPETLHATLPVRELVGALMSHGFRAELSDDAGRYLCNHLFYRGLHDFGGQFPYGFVHVPPVDTMGGVLTLKDLARAVALIANRMHTQTV